MRFSIALIGFFATQALCNPVAEGNQPRDDEQHPAVLGIKSPLYDPNQPEENLQRYYNVTDEVTDGEDLEARGRCSSGGRGRGRDYDFGCDNGWCWRNCNGPFAGRPRGKTWCWMAYENGNGGYTPCGRWQDCKWSDEHKNTNCKKGNCAACGCSC